VNQRGFAGAIGADERVDLAVLHIQARVVRGRETTKTLDEVLHAQQRNGAHACSFLPERRLIRPLGASSTTASSTAPKPICQ
jgi:hypothetical protein